MRKAAALAGTVGSVLFAGVLVILTFIEYDFMRSLGWEPLGLSHTDWPSVLALGPHGYRDQCLRAGARRLANSFSVSERRRGEIWETAAKRYGRNWRTA